MTIPSLQELAADAALKDPGIYLLLEHPGLPQEWRDYLTRHLPVNNLSEAYQAAVGHFMWSMNSDTGGLHPGEINKLIILFDHVESMLQEVQGGLDQVLAAFYDQPEEAQEHMKSQLTPFMEKVNYIGQSTQRYLAGLRAESQNQ